jgi:hypothetical protein
MINGKQLTVCCYVDDLLCTSVVQADIKWLYEELSKVFKKVKFTDSDEFEFVSFEISQRGGQISVAMDKYINTLLEEWAGEGKDGSPAGDDLFERDPDSKRLDAECTIECC